MLKKRNLTFCCIIILGILLVVMLLRGCGSQFIKHPPRTLFVDSGGRIKTLDPVLAADLCSRDMVAACYDTLLQYDYTARPYKLIPSMLSKMPELSADGKEYTFTLRDDLFFTPDKCFESTLKAARKINSDDVIFSFLRIADGRLHSPVYWMFRGKIVGIDSFREATQAKAQGNFSLYAEEISGLKKIDDLTFKIILNRPDPRFLYALAIPYASIVSRKAVEYYGEQFAEHPVGSGPFVLKEWLRDYRLILDANREYRTEFYAKAANKLDRTKPLPLLDRVVCYVIKQPVASWLLFLQGELDFADLSSKDNKDNADAVISSGGELVPVLQQRGIRLQRVPEFEVRYIGFNFSDPILANNLYLRKAITLAYDIAARVRHANNQVVPADGPIPPGVAGNSPTFRNKYRNYNLDLAKEYMRKAGYPNGIDPKTGKALELTFDQKGNSAFYRQLAELMAHDMKKIGIKIVPVLNSHPRFFQKLREGKFQLFRFSWIGDYPDGENFLQLFYGKNAGSCNRVFYRDQHYDSLYEEVVTMADSPARTANYEYMVKYLTEHCPWIFESYPTSYCLLHKWLQNYLPHDFAFCRWKYLSFDPQLRKDTKSKFKPLALSELRSKQL